jgi:LacI family transcriptional regulator
MTLKAKDIAKILDLSPTTISMVLNNKPGISEETRKKVEEKLNELGYGHLLKRNKTHEMNIAFVVYKRFGDIIMESPFFLY